MTTDHTTTRHEWAVFFRVRPESPLRIFTSNKVANERADEANLDFPHANPPAFYVAHRTVTITPWEAP